MDDSAGTETTAETRTDVDRGQVAATAAETYETFFLPALFQQWAVPLLDAAKVSSGDHMLDVGCGTGVVAREAISRVGQEGRVVGIDPNEGMLAVARRTLGVEWRKGIAEDLPFESNSFDVVVCQFALMFFEDREQAISEIQRVLRPGGRVAVATWASLAETPGYAAVVDILDRLFGPDAGDALRSPYNMGDPREVRDLLATSLVDVVVSNQEGTARFDSIEDWVHTDIRGWTLSDMSDQDYQALLAAARAELVQFTNESGGVSFPAPALIGVARAPETSIPR